MIVDFKKLLFFFLFSSCIIVAPERTDHDLYSSPQNLLAQDHKEVKGRYIEISAEEIEILKPKQIYLFATWCSNCLLELKTGKEKFSETMLISINYNILSFEKHFSRLYDTIYILDNHVYGDQEREKLSRFVFELTRIKDINYSVPKKFHLDEESGQYRLLN